MGQELAQAELAVPLQNICLIAENHMDCID
jgi:hypothetical protein